MAIVGAIVCGVAVTWTAASFGYHLVGCRSLGGGSHRIARQRVRETSQGIWMHMIDTDRCPSHEDLIAGQYVAQRSLVDPWGTSIVFRCVPGIIVSVRSAGPDHIFHTGDDITND
jgi:hypothetical protein